MPAKFNRLLAIFILLFLGQPSTPTFAAAIKMQKSGLTYLIDKTPAWVERQTSPAVGSASPQNGSTQILLSDTQVNLLGTKPITYVHGKVLSTERSGLENISTIRISFNPRFETLTLHDLAIFRDGRRLEQTNTARVDLAQRERRLEEGIYDEDVEAIVALADVRVGDIVEYGYSIAGENPIFSGRHSSFFVLNRDQPVARLSIRIQYPANRKLFYQMYRSDLPIIETQERSIRKLALNGENLPPIRPEDAVPAWFGMYPMLQVSEFSNWSEVSTWAKNLYDVPKDLSPEIESVLDKLKVEAKNPETLAALALAWVQNEIRYYSIVVGTSSHRPNHPNITVRQRFGDCKDKSLLLAAMLQRLGIQAEPALVSHRIGKRIADLLPTPLAFDHVIVQARIGDRTYWLDGTRTYQGSDLNTLGFTIFGKALVAGGSQTDGLVEQTLPQEARSGTSVTETFKLEKYGTPTVLTLQQRYFGHFAESVRNQISANGIRRLVEALQSDYGRDFPNIAVIGEPGIVDDPVANTLTLTQNFTVPQVFSYETGRAKANSIYARSMLPWLRFPGSPERKFPLALHFPDSYEHNVIFDLPNKLPFTAPAPETWQDRHYALSSRISVGGQRVTFNYSARILQDHVAAQDFPTFSEKFKQGSMMLFSSLSVPLVENAKLRNRLTRDFEIADINFRKPDQLDNLHQKFLRDLAIADESIGSGHIAGSLLAKAYKDRAQASSLLGKKDDALADVNRAIEISPDDASHVLKAEILLYMGRYQEALQALEHVTHEKNSTNTLIAAGMANFYLGKYADASQALTKATEVAGADDLPYSLIWLGLALKKAGRPADELIARHAGRLATGWPADAVSFMQGKTREENLINAAKQDEKESRLRLCEAYFYLGQKALLDGNTGDAKRWFAKSVETKAFMYREHIFSQQELKRVDRQ